MDEFVRRTEEAFERYIQGKFKKVDKKEFLKIIESW